MKIRETQVQIHRKMLRRILLVAVERLTSTQRRGVEAYLGACKLSRSKRGGRTDDELLVYALSMYLPDSAPLRALNRSQGQTKHKGQDSNQSLALKAMLSISTSPAQKNSLSFNPLVHVRVEKRGLAASGLLDAFKKNLGGFLGSEARTHLEECFSGVARSTRSHTGRRAKASRRPSFLARCCGESLQPAGEGFLAPGI